MQKINGFLFENWKCINEVYKTNIYCLIRDSGLKLWALGDINSTILLRGCAPQQNSTIDVTSGP